MNPIRKSQNFYEFMALLLTVLGLLIGLVSFSYMIKSNNFKLNEIGDFLSGSVGVIWGLAGLILVYVAFLGQKEQLINQGEELKLSREEQKLIRKEMKAQREQMELQNKAINNEQFENTFFKLLNYHDQNTEYLLKAVWATERSKGGPVSTGSIIESVKEGKKAFPRLALGFKSMLREEFSKLIDNDKSLKENTIEQIQRMYFSLTNRYNKDMEFGEELEIYCRSVFNIFDFIDGSKIENKEAYSNLLINQMPLSEKIVLIYMTVLADERTGFSELANNYSVFRNVIEHLERTKESFKWEVLEFFTNNAFGVTNSHFEKIKKERLHSVDTP